MEFTFLYVSPCVSLVKLTTSLEDHVPSRRVCYVICTGIKKSALIWILTDTLMIFPKEFYFKNAEEKSMQINQGA